MSGQRVTSDLQLVNGSTGDPVLYVDYPDSDNALLFDGGDNAALSMAQLRDLTAVFITHHHMDHFVGIDRILRANTGAKLPLNIFGPPGTTERVAQRLRSYEHVFFDGQNMVIVLHDIGSDSITRMVLESESDFDDGETESTRWKPLDPIFENEDVQVEAAPTDHTVPGLAFALVEKPGWRLDEAKLAKGLLRRGPWIAQVRQALLQKKSQKDELQIQQGTFRIGDLAQQYFRQAEGCRIAYVADTFWSPKVQPGLIQLAQGSEILYCDSFYAEKQAAAAETYRHMTAKRAGIFARKAKVDELVLIHFSLRYKGRYDLLIQEAQAEFPAVRAEN